ncbi:copper amine oxidase domain protein [Ammonifex degensii KC4]|uniref:Copper amine oxidase domain protein n=1 Tax=Ammonifex degensii (strain DSM 10501 / KC4) TaxID=429009 RepID=C9RCF2_AMMDK|nr:copper amine oxidase N-terminal domain-containing protein [Ammonifex degensii]ACX51929.1 copper amine oxidase domain protein [Ammonifex degensii KC4]
MRKAFGLASLLVAFALALFAWVPPGPAAELHAKFVIGKTTYWVKGQGHSMDVAPFVENDRTYVPVRFLAYALGVPESGVEWDPAARKVTLTKDGTTVALVVGRPTVWVNGRARAMDVAPLVIPPGRTVLPARFVAEAFGYTVVWDNATRSVLVYAPEPSGYRIDMALARAGKLAPPPGAVAPPDSGNTFSFPPSKKCRTLECRVGSRYATVTDWDGNTYTVDLGTECVLAGDAATVQRAKEWYPHIYNDSNTYVIPGLPDNSLYAVYVPFLKVAELIGVPKGNVVWDGEHLAVFGYKGKLANYQVFAAGSREVVANFSDYGEKISLVHPLLARDGLPMYGTSNMSDIKPLCCYMLRCFYDGGFNHETGVYRLEIRPLMGTTPQ